ncbi:Nif11-like leader peptide family natural product precursor [Nostoc punctiforme]|nr:Nif11-like leader peptide family natural product precursor [Nostoc punctiforme]
MNNPNRKYKNFKMSIQSAKALYTKLLVDEEFRTKLEQTANQQERRQILQAGGFDYTPDELNLAKAELLESAAINNELSETDLQEIVGGGLHRLISPDGKSSISMSHFFDSFNVYLT